MDLSRFAVETLRQIDPDLQANYLMIEFSPVTLVKYIMVRKTSALDAGAGDCAGREASR